MLHVYFSLSKEFIMGRNAYRQEKAEVILSPSKSMMRKAHSFSFSWKNTV